MKKLFFIAMIVLGTSLAQAQEDITIRVVTNSNDDKIAVGVNNDDLCFDSVTILYTDVHSYNHTSGVLTLNDDVLQIYEGRRKDGINNYFNLYVTEFYNSNRRNAILGTAQVTQDGGQYSINN